jgi:hypothetical protein
MLQQHNFHVSTVFQPNVMNSIKKTQCYEFSTQLAIPSSSFDNMTIQEFKSATGICNYK